ncbi:gliding motility-associated C-terminal domain-containing protein [Sanyastnella coralliicola]|uniref:T9SS type B sorting domain-containing protein n=1 Tax=Sanyastnella coralliicola TaxID=3069118 RepID=UPI0027BA17A3|nr:gliding motility-associated C-terminal domain-containing protein [Longitalea sp. SCSIO 12813]
MISTFRLFFFVGFCLLASVASSQYSWVGGNGSWNDPSHWSSSEGANGIGLPAATDYVVIPSNAQITIDETAQCADLISEGDAQVQLTGNGTLNVSGDLIGNNLVISIPQVTFSAGVHQIDLAQAQATNFHFNNGCEAHLLKTIHTGGTISGDECLFHLNGRGVVCDRFLFSDARAELDVASGKIYVNEQLEVDSGVEVDEFEPSIWPNDEATINPGALTVNVARTATCGTGPGQTPFTITASVATNYNGEDISCNGAEDGEATVSVVGGVGPFSFQWIGGDSPGFLQSYTGLGAGTYTVLVTDQGQGITCVDNVQLTEPPPLTVFDFIYTPPSCTGNCDGSGTPIVIGGVAPYDFDWGNGETTQTAFALCEGNNTLEFTDLNGCAFDTSFVVEVVPIYANLDITNVLCNGTSTGAVTANPEGGTGGSYQVDWSTGDDGNTVTGLDANSYTVTITDIGGCSYDTAFVITEEPPVTITLDNSNDPSCDGGNDGTIEITINGGLAPYDTDWTGPNGFVSTDEDLTTLEAGTYDLTVTDQNGCQALLSVTLDNPDAIVVDEDIEDIECFGDANGSIEISISGGQPNYTTDWTGPNGYTSGDEDISNLENGVYDLVVTDDNGCQAFFSYNITSPFPIDVDETITPISCSGADDGQIDISITGGSNPYDADWTGPGGFNTTGTSISGLEPGTYDLVVTDDNGCQAFFSYELEDPDPLVFIVFITPISCNGANDASITVTVAGGTAPYDFSWTGPNGFVSTDQNLVDLGPGTYDLTVTDDAGCQGFTTAVIAEPDPITLIPDITDLSCGGAGDGEIDLSILGGTPDYDVDWTGPNGFTSTDEDITNLEAGDYDVVVTDVEGCQVLATYTVSELPPIVLTLDVTPISCNGADDAAIDLSIAGGQPPYDVSWAGPNLFISTMEDISGLEPGFYNVLVVDQNGCFTESSVEITEPDAIDVTVDSVDPECNGEATGSITLTINGGVDPVTVSWDSGDNGPILTDLPAGDYEATVTDGSGCSVVLPVITLTEAPAIDISVDVTHVQCAGDTNGAIDLTVSGGTGDLSISWTGPNGFASNDEDIDNLEAGTYDLTVTDDLGCTETQAVTINENSPIMVDFSTALPLCADDLISIDITITGGQPPYDVSWTGPDGFTSTDEDLVDEAQGVYDLTVTDDLGCIFTASADLTAPDPLTATADLTELDCSGDPIAAIDLTVSGGLPPYDISWTGPNGFNSTDEDIDNLEAGTYEVTILDNFDCELIQSFEFVQPISLDVDVNVTDPLCFGDNTGAIDIEISGGTAPYFVTWTGPNAFNSTAEDISNLEAGSYDLFIVDSGNCDANLTIDVVAPDEIQVDATITNVLCGGGATGAIEIDITGGVGPYVTVWTAPGFNSVAEDLFDLEAGSYQLDLVDSQGCLFSASYDVSEETPITIDLNTEDSTCGDNSGSAEATATGGVDPITIEWFDENMISIGNGGTISDLAAGNYFVTATDDNGCFLTQGFTISDSDAIQLDSDATDPLCSGDTNGAIDLTITGGTGNITLGWVGPNGFVSDQEDIADLEAGDYTVTVVDELGCQSSLLVTLSEPETLVLTAATAPVSCGATDNGSIDLTITGGTPDYTISWVGPNAFVSDQEDLTGLEAGIYDLQVEDFNGCSEVLSVEVIQTTSVEADFVVTNITCAGDNDGSISTSITSGESPFDFVWSGPDGFTNTNSDIALLEPGDYNLVVTDAIGCTLDTTLTVTENPAVTIDVTTVQPNCLANDGALEAVVSGGQVADDYTYFWYDLDNGNALIGTEALLEDIPSGSYFLEVFDDLGCFATAEITLADNAGELEADITTPLCFGDANGAIDLTVVGATAPFTYSWAGPNGFTSDQEDIADLEAGDYAIEVIDDLGCLLASTFTVDQPDSLITTLVEGDLLCADGNTGTILAAIDGGTQPYTINWTSDNGFTSTEQSLSDLAPGCYYLEIIDDNGCVAQDTACVEAPEALLLDAILTDIACFGDSTGSIEITATGGVGGFTYDWTGPGDFVSSDEDLFDVPAGGYELTVTDLNFCTLDTLLVLAQNPQIVFEIDTILPSCPGFNDGSITVTPSGGIAPYDVAWYEDDIPVATGETYDNLAAGEYHVAVSDAFGCVVSETITLVNPEPFELDTVLTDISCFGAADGSIEILIAGGEAPYSTFWIGPNGFSSTQEDIFSLELGTYELTLGDANGCVQVFSFDINEPEELTISLDEINNTSCLISSDGSIEITIEGGTPEFTFVWEDEEANTFDTEDLLDIPVGNYNVVVTDANGCEVSVEDIPVGFSGDVTADAGPDAAHCFGIETNLIGTNTGGDGSFWADSLGTQIDSGDLLDIFLDPGVYEFIYVAQDGDCISQDTVLVTIYDLPLADAGLDQEVYFEEQTTLGGNPAADEENLIVWTPSDLLLGDDVPNPTTVEMTENAIFVLEVTDLNGCVSIDSVMVTVIPELDVPSGFTPNGDNMNDLWTLGNNLFYPSLNVEIYNRWGDLLFRDDRGYANAWDGTFNGNPLPIGTYYYVITIDEPEFKTTLTGPVTILR